MVRRTSDAGPGIVISVHGFHAEVVFGDGQRDIVATHELLAIHFKPGVPASFPELVDAYITCRGFG